MSAVLSELETLFYSQLLTLAPMGVVTQLVAMKFEILPF